MRYGTGYIHELCADFYGGHEELIEEMRLTMSPAECPDSTILCCFLHEDQHKRQSRVAQISWVH